MEDKFINLKMHTEYTLLEGVGKIDEYIDVAKSLDVNTLSITDTSMFGVIEFYKKCKKKDIKPIIGLEVYMDGILTEGEYSLTLLAKNEKGYENLSKLSSLSYSRFNRRKNKIKYEELTMYSEGLFILSGGVYGEIVQDLINLRYPEAKKVIKKLNEDFGNNFFVEIPCSNKLDNVRKELIEIIEELELDYIFTNDVYYPKKEDKILQNILKAIKDGNKLDVENKKNIFDDLYFKNYIEIKSNFLNYSDDFFDKGIKNINFIVENCNVEFEFNNFKFPEYSLPENINEKEYLEYIVYLGLEKRYLVEKDYSLENMSEICQKIKKDLLNAGYTQVVDRIEYELKIINDMGYNGYFIIVWDFIKFAKENSIYVGPGRGSAAGSLVSFALNITEIDPLKYNLIFERFLNPERISMPDIDIDFDQEQREMVLNYVLEKYGKDRVAHIITFGTLKARAAIRDVGRVLNIDLRKVDKVAKLIPFNVDLKEGLEKIPNLKLLYEKDREVKDIIDYSMKIEGKVRHASIHAAGIVISKEKLEKEIPLYSDGKSNVYSTQYQMKELEDLGILKIDFLGLKNLTILRKTIENIKITEGKDWDLYKIPLDDKKTYELMTEAKTLGIFQCESPGIRKLMKKVKINKFEDIIALLALYRPGPLRSGMVDDFIESKNNGSKIKYLHESLKEILKETYGVILYQEQVMRIANVMGNYTLGEADELRRAIGKKQPELIEKNREKFLKNATENGINKKIANDVYNLVDKFGGYGFNKSHSAAYALIAYWTAFFKVNYSMEFFAGVMSTEMYNVDRLSEFISEARDLGIKILTPHINKSSYEFSVEKEGIRFGMTAIKGVGINFVEKIIEERKNPFKNYEDFVYRMKQHGLNKKNLESLIYSGAVDCFKGNRREKIESIEKILEWANKKYDEDENLQMILFGGKTQKVEDFFMEKYENYQKKYLLKQEKEYLGVYVSDHILSEYENILKIVEHSKISDVKEDFVKNSKKELKLIGIVKDKKSLVTKSGEPMVKFLLEDYSGEIEVVCFPKKYVEYGYKIFDDKIVYLTGEANEDNGKVTIFINSVTEIDKLYENKKLKIYILIDEDKNILEKLKKAIIKYSGENEIYFAKKSDGKNEIKKLNDKYNVRLTKSFICEIEDIVGFSRVKII